MLITKRTTESAIYLKKKKTIPLARFELPWASSLSFSSNTKRIN